MTDYQFVVPADRPGAATRPTDPQIFTSTGALLLYHCPSDARTATLQGYDYFANHDVIG